MKLKLEQLKPNEGKKLEIVVDGAKYIRYPIKTHVVSDKDTITNVVKKYAGQYLQDGDMVVISERVVAITQGRAIPI
ncbi:MAG: F420-0--gamma-glutamyl ligase, partial [Alphaproteobacteria bacterium]